MCWFFFFVSLLSDHMDWLLVSSTTIGGKIDGQIKWHLLCYQTWLAKWRKLQPMWNRTRLEGKMKGGWERWKKKEEKKGEDKQSEGKVRIVKRGLRALKEIRKYQSGTVLLKRRLPFHRVIKQIAQELRADLHLQSRAMMALQEAGENFWWAFWNNQLCVPCMWSMLQSCQRAYS